MGLNVFWVDFKELSKETTFRFDVDFVYYQKNFSIKKYYTFSVLFDFRKDNKVNIEDLNNDFFYSEISNVSQNGEVEPVRLNFSDRKEEEKNYYKKIENGDIIQVKENDILISKVRPNLKKYVFIDNENSKYFYTSAFIHLKPKKLNKIFYYAFRTIFYEDLIAISRQGKGYPTLNENDFLYLKFDKNAINKLIQKQDEIVAQIEPIEKKIKELKATIKEPQEIINEVFAREFGFDLKKFEELKKEKFFEVDLSEFSKHKDLRFGMGVRKANINLKPYISKSFEYKSLGKIISLEYGSGLTDQQRVEGDYPVMGANGIVGYHNKFLIEGPSIIVGRKGSAGEINYIEENNFPIDTCFYVKFIEKQNIVYFSYLLKFLQLKRLTLFKGVPGLNRYDVYDVKIPNISLETQQKIVDEIKAELDKQEEIKKQIEIERNKIDEIIENAIK